MLFNSFAFICLALVTFSIYYQPVLSKYQINILIISSLIFYAYNQPVLVLLLLSSVGINIVSSYKVVYGKEKNKKAWAISGVVLNLLILILFKYSTLISKTLFSGSNSLSEFLLNIPLPIGISFFTFQGLSLVVDVFSERYDNNKNVIPQSLVKHSKRTLFFISFFPQLIAGPIVKAHEFMPQIKQKYFKDINWEKAFKALVTGYFLKMVVADNLKNFTFWIAYPYFQKQATSTLVSMLFGYSFQIFADFAGYSLIAIGLAELFGYHFKDNFNFPYISTSFKEFWKRWHISLSSFLMEYLYFPLGGNRRGKKRTYFNLMIVMLLGGLWHGAAWSYAVWGGVHGLALAMERFITDNSKNERTGAFRVFKIVIIFVFVSFAWLLFKLPEFNHVILYFLSIYNNFNLQADIHKITYLFLYSAPVMIYHAFYLLKEHKFYTFAKKYEFVIYGLMIFLIITNSGSPGAFIYFQF